MFQKHNKTIYLKLLKTYFTKILQMEIILNIRTIIKNSL
ncbi:hypothetical protein CP10881SC42_0004 [Chlamydia avium]|uniref:Uncharacterized protein n=1 Tax=Chlamydia avium TaxID=1457141 RepID=A0ABP2X7M6_9CHLA|nr:hypothetical protein CP10881SC42_0004 [Chlamydia avium]